MNRSGSFETKTGRASGALLFGIISLDSRILFLVEMIPRPYRTKQSSPSFANRLSAAEILFLRFSSNAPPPRVAPFGTGINGAFDMARVCPKFYRRPIILSFDSIGVVAGSLIVFRLKILMSDCRSRAIDMVCAIEFHY